MEIRVYRGQELPEDIRTAVKAGNLAAFGWSDSATESDFDNRLALYYVMLEENDEQVLGYIGLHVIADEAMINTVFVLPSERKHGIGAQLLDFACDHLLRQAGVTQILLDVRAENVPALRLYEQADFEKLALRKAYYQNPSDDGIVMRRLLKKEG